MALPTNTGAFIHNGVNCTPNVIQTAQGVPYDNTSSGLSATNVQSAINEVYTCCIPLIYGTQTASTGNWVGELNISALYDGLTINYYLPYDSDGNVSLNLTLANGSTTGSKPVYLQIGKRLSTQFSAGATILITYYSAGSISKSGTPTDADMWICNAESMQVQQVYIPNPPDIPYPVLFGVGLSVGNILGPTVKDIYNLNYNPASATLLATNISTTSINDINLSGFTNNTGFHNSIYRGKNLGNTITEEQYAQISAGTFDDLFIGDYWAIETTVGGTVYTFNYTIAAFDYWYMVDDDSTPPVSAYKHHIALYVEQGILTASMNGTNTTAGGYLGSEMYTANLNNMRNSISDLFGNHVYPVPRYFTNSVNSSGQANGYACTMSTLDLMSETMVYGHSVWGTSGFEIGADKTILPIFALNPFKAFSSNNSGSKTYYWLSSVASSTHFSLCNGTGVASYAAASVSAYLKPIFALKGDTN